MSVSDALQNLEGLSNYHQALHDLTLVPAMHAVECVVTTCVVPCSKYPLQSSNAFYERSYRLTRDEIFNPCLAMPHLVSNSGEQPHLRQHRPPCLEDPLLGLVWQGKIKSLEQIYLFSLPVKEYQIVENFLGSALKDEVMKIMPVQKQTRAGQRTRFKVSSLLLSNHDTFWANLVDTSPPAVMKKCHSSVLFASEQALLVDY